jgi:exodeoxyribonuclease-5
LLATGCRVIACGDPGQLPPVRGSRFFTAADVTLTEVRRQALDSAIIRQAHNIRNSGNYSADGPDFRVQGTCSEHDVMDADILITWTNATRRQLNHLKRAYKGLIGKPPLAGEPVMALKNDHRASVLNGSVMLLLEDYEPGSGVVRVRNERGERVKLYRSWIEDFDEPLEDTDTQRAHPFALAYACTAHKAQGSEWPSVLVVDEMPRGREEWCCWTYTAVTRASKSVLIKI